ncbi:MAG: hypothetical protein WAV78_21120 [Xanthobacteraceae bacterium]
MATRFAKLRNSAPFACVDRTFVKSISSRRRPEKKSALPARDAGFEHGSQLVSPLIPKATVFNNMAFDAMCHKEVRSWIVQKITLDWLEYNWLELNSS